MSAEPDIAAGDDHKKHQIDFDRHAPEFRDQFAEITKTMHGKCPVAWTEAYGGHWVAGGANEVFAIARSQNVSSDHDVRNERRGYRGAQIPPPEPAPPYRGGFIEMDPPEQKYFRDVLNPYLSPAAVQRWLPFVDEVVRACIDDRIETGSIDFVDDLANVVPAVLTLAMMGIPIDKWKTYSDPTHAAVYTRPGTPEMVRVREQQREMMEDLAGEFYAIRDDPRPGLVDALARLEINGEKPLEAEIRGTLALLIGGGFDTTTALTARSLQWLSENPDERERLSQERDELLNSATEEFLRYFTPAAGNARTISADCEISGQEFKESERVLLSWAMANRDDTLFEDPDTIDFGRRGNRHFSFGVGVHRCMGSNVARTLFKRMLVAVLDRMPDYKCDPEGAVPYDTIGVIQGMKNLPATFTPGTRIGPGLEETLKILQKACIEQRLAEPITQRKGQAAL